MRNIFDQYKHHENRLTHALVSSLAADPSLLRSFVRWATGSNPPSRRLAVLEQTLPGEEEPIEEDESERRGLPDGWIHDHGRWALVIESKIESSLTLDQLQRHRRMAERRGFTEVHLLALVIDLPGRQFPSEITLKKWTQLYTWILGQPQSEWTRRLAAYMEILERKMVADTYLKEGTLTVFSGIPFNKKNPYNYPEGKRLIRLALEELRGRKRLTTELGMNPTGKGRTAITGHEGTRVWDFLPLSLAAEASNFTKFPHLTLSIQQEQLLAIVTVPNGIERAFRRRLLNAGTDAFSGIFEDIFKNMKRSIGPVQGAAPWLEVLQRHYPSQRSEPVIDSKLQFDLRTAFGSRGWGKEVKEQPEWLENAYQSLSNKASNLQLGVGAIFRYESCPRVHTSEILDSVADVWLACKPLIRAMVG